MYKPFISTSVVVTLMSCLVCSSVWWVTYTMMLPRSRRTIADLLLISVSGSVILTLWIFTPFLIWENLGFTRWLHFGIL